MQIELTKQTLSKNPWKYENHLLSYYRSAQINDEARFVDIYKKGIYNELRKLLLVHEPLLTTMVDLKVAVHCYQTNLLKYARSTASLATSATTGLGTLQHKDTDQRRKTMQQNQELQ